MRMCREGREKGGEEREGGGRWIGGTVSLRRWERRKKERKWDQKALREKVWKEASVDKRGNRMTRETRNYSRVLS